MQSSDEELELISSESSCSYLPDQRSRMQYRLVFSLSAARYEHLLERGWRRFGRTLFRPFCRRCDECRSLRVSIPSFAPTKSQRRISRKSAEITHQVVRPQLTPEHVQLYNSWHLDMHERRGWPYREITEDDYFESFIDGEFEFSREFQYRQDGRLVAVGIVDMTGRVMSSIYFMHVPEIRQAAPGTLSVLREIEEGARTNHQWLYLGYYIRDCGSMNYKNRFGPHEFLSDYVADDQAAVWNPPSANEC